MTLGMVLALVWVLVVIGGVISLLETDRGWNAFLRIFGLQRFVTVTPPLPESLIFRPQILRRRDVILLVVGGTTLVSTLAIALLQGTVPQLPPDALPAQIGWIVVIGVGSGIALAVVVVQIARMRYLTQLDRMLVPAFDRLLTAMTSGRSFSQALATVTFSLPESPLRAEWQWLLEHLGALRGDGTRMMLHEVCATLAAQTISPRHASALLRLGDALQRPHDAQVSSIQVMVQAMQEMARRQSFMTVELAQLRTSGIAITLINLGLTVYLAIVQWDRMVTAYTSPVGPFVACLFLGLICLPIVAGWWLSRLDDLIA
jgi:Flp pilus assembly protein TadB